MNPPIEDTDREGCDHVDPTHEGDETRRNERDAVDTTDDDESTTDQEDCTSRVARDMVIVL